MNLTRIEALDASMISSAWTTFNYLALIIVAVAGWTSHTQLYCHDSSSLARGKFSCYCCLEGKHMKCLFSLQDFHLALTRSLSLSITRMSDELFCVARNDIFYNTKKKERGNVFLCSTKFVIQMLLNPFKWKNIFLWVAVLLALSILITILMDVNFFYFFIYQI